MKVNTLLEIIEYSRPSALHMYPFSKFWISTPCVLISMAWCGDTCLFTLLSYEGLVHGNKWQIQKHNAYWKSIKASIIKQAENWGNAQKHYWSIIDSSLDSKVL